MTQPERVERTCFKCEVTDSHAHHVQYVALNHPVSGQSVDLSITRHIQCCAEDGCPICEIAVKHAREILDENDLLPSDRFNEFMASPPREYFAELFEVHGLTSPEFDYPKEESRPT
jgi:hypothetical protein